MVEAMVFYKISINLLLSMDRKVKTSMVDMTIRLKDSSMWDLRIVQIKREPTLI